MKANLVIPSWSYWKEPLRAQPLTQLYLATILENKGLEVEITDFRDGPKIVNTADLYLYTICSPDYLEVKELSNSIRQQNGGIHIAGGPHPTLVPNETKGFDSIIIGQGESALDKIVDDFPNLEPVYKLPIKGEYPFPRRHFLDESKIVNDNLFKTDQLRSTTAQFSFGCPFTCTFCANYEPGPIRSNSLEKISEEIDYLKKEYKIKGLSLQDEIAIPLNREKAKEYLKMLTSKDIKWRGQIRVLKEKDYNQLDLAKESGLVELSFGLESVNEDVLTLANKRIKVSDVEKMIHACRERDIKTRIYLLNGLPGEPEDIVSQTKNFIERTNPDLVLLSSLQPYPGSPIADNPEKFGIKWVSKEYDKFNHLLCRFEDSKDNPMDAVPYEFEDGFSREQIMENMLNLQEFLRERDMNK